MAISSPSIVAHAAVRPPNARQVRLDVENRCSVEHVDAADVQGCAGSSWSAGSWVQQAKRTPADPPSARKAPPTPRNASRRAPERVVPPAGHPRGPLESVTTMPAGTSSHFHSAHHVASRVR